MANELAKSANLRCRLEGVVFFRHFLRRTDDRDAHKRVKTFFARGNRVRRRSGLRWWSGRRRWLLLPEQSNGNCHQCNKHKTESFRVRQLSPDCVFDASLVPGTCLGRFLDLKGLINNFLEMCALTSTGLLMEGLE